MKYTTWIIEYNQGMSVLTAYGVPAADARGSLRPVNVHRDLSSIADLVELCFSDTLDPDGHSYLQQMRAASRAGRFFDWAYSAVDQPDNSPITGYVWEVDGKIVGNLSLITFQHRKQRLYLIANVAVHPEYRRRGIARQLTATALGYLQRRGLPSAWLHVRDDNPAAIHLYETLGFTERTRRTTWRSLPLIPPVYTLPGLKVGLRRLADWPQQRLWLEESYPAAFSWHLSVDWQALGPGWRNALYRFFTFNYPRHWVVRSDETLMGVVSRLHTDAYADPLYLAVPPDCPSVVIQMLLTQMRRDIPSHIHLSLNCPAELAPESIQAAGFSTEQTLIWMQKIF